MATVKKPVAVCTRCGAITRNVAAINQPCRRVINGRKCKGVFGSALCENDWELCPSCNGTGIEGRSQCSQCEGAGWIFVRK